jgi:hypothetical protein
VIVEIYDKRVFVYKAGEVPEPLKVQVEREETRKPLNLSGASAIFSLFTVNAAGTRATVIDSRAAAVDAGNGIVTHTWQAGDLVNEDKYFGVFFITLSDSSVISIPKRRYFEFEVEAL